MKALIFGFFSLILADKSFAAISLAYDVSDELSANNRKIVVEAMQVAIHYVRSLPPPRQNPFKSNVKREVGIIVMNSNNPLAIQYSGDHSPTNSDAYTFTVGEHESTKLNTYVFLFADRLVWDPTTGKQRADAFVRLMVALAHEIYGNVTDQLSLQAGVIPIATFESRKATEIKAFKAGIAFIHRFISSKFKDNIEGSLLRDALAREAKELKYWEEATSCGPEIFIFAGRRAPRN